MISDLEQQTVAMPQRRGALNKRSGSFQPAVSRISNPPTPKVTDAVAPFNGLPNGSPRYTPDSAGETCTANGSEFLVLVAPERDLFDMARLASGDQQALDALMQRHAKQLFAHLERIVKNRADAAELVQEAFVRVFRHRLNYDYESRFTTWLYVIGSHLAINLLRWRSRRPEHVPLPDGAEENSGGDADTFVDPAPTPREQAQRDEWTDALEQALARLPPQLREPMLLVCLDGCSQAEAAARLGCTVKAVETRLYHGRKRLRAELECTLNPWRCRVRAAIRPQTCDECESFSPCREG